MLPSVLTGGADLGLGTDFYFPVEIHFHFHADLFRQEWSDTWTVLEKVFLEIRHIAGLSLGQRPTFPGG